MTLPPWRVIGASVQGTSHVESGAPCQDAHLYRILDGGELLIVVADGAGSAARAETGAFTAVTELAAALASALAQPLPNDESGWRQVVAGAFRAAREALEQLAEAEQIPLRALATTLTCALAAGDWLVAGQIGDGAVVAEDASGDLFLAVQPQRGEYANEAYFLTMPDALDYLAIRAEARPVRALAVTTDGLLRLALKLPGYEPHAPFFQPLLAFAAEADDEEQAAEQLAAFLQSERVCARTDDDKTLVLAVRPEAGRVGGGKSEGDGRLRFAAQAVDVGRCQGTRRRGGHLRRSRPGGRAGKALRPCASWLPGQAGADEQQPAGRPQSPGSHLHRLADRPALRRPGTVHRLPDARHTGRCTVAGGVQPQAAGAHVARLQLALPASGGAQPGRRLGRAARQRLRRRRPQ